MPGGLWRTVASLALFYHPENMFSTTLRVQVTKKLSGHGFLGPTAWLFKCLGPLGLITNLLPARASGCKHMPRIITEFTKFDGRYLEIQKVRLSRQEIQVHP